MAPHSSAFLTGFPSASPGWANASPQMPLSAPEGPPWFLRFSLPILPPPRLGSLIFLSPSFFPLGWSTSYSVPRASLTEPHRPLLIIAIPACLSFHKPHRSKSPKDETESLGDNYPLPGRLSLLELLSGHISHNNLHPVTCVYVNGFLDHKHTQAWVWAWSPGLRAKEHTRLGWGEKNKN